jgi:hypothetical protein
MAVLTDPRYQNLAAIAASGLHGDAEIYRVILAQFASEKAGEWPPQDNNPGNLHIGAIQAAGGPTYPHGVGDNGAVALLPDPVTGANLYAFYITNYGPAASARAAIAAGNAPNYISAVTGFGYGTNPTTWQDNYAAAASANLQPPSVSSGAGAGSTGSGGGAASGSGSLPSGGGTTPPAAPDTAAIFRNVYVAMVQLSEAVGYTPSLPWWASAQGLTGNHMGVPPTVADGTDYIAAQLANASSFAARHAGAGAGSFTPTPVGTVASSDTSPASALAPLYIGLVDVDRAVGLTAQTPPWAVSQGLTGEHWGTPPDLLTGADWVATQVDAAITTAGGTPNPPAPAPPASGGGAGSTGSAPGGTGGAGSGVGAGGSGGGASSGAGGGSTGTPAQGIPPPTIAPPAASAPGMAGVQSSWGDLMNLFGTTIPQSGAAVAAAIARVAGQ